LIFANARFGGYGFPGHPFANLIETQCHIFDQLEYLMGPIESVAAEMADLTGKGCSTMAIALKFASGAVGNLLGSYDSSYDYPETHRLEINGAEGRLIVRDTVKEYEFQRSGSETAERWQAGYFNDEGRGFHQTFDLYVDHLLEAFRAGDPPPVPAETGRRSLKLALAAIKSHKTGRRVAV
jgi:predicted dehydrogenase